MKLSYEDAITIAIVGTGSNSDKIHEKALNGDLDAQARVELWAASREVLVERYMVLFDKMMKKLNKD